MAVTNEVTIQNDQQRTTTLMVHIRTRECRQQLERSGHARSEIMIWAFKIGQEHLEKTDEARLLRQVCAKLGTVPNLQDKRLCAEIAYGFHYRDLNLTKEQLRPAYEIGIQTLFLKESSR